MQNTKKQLTIMESLIQRDTIEIVRTPQHNETKNQYMDFVKTQNSDQMLSIKEFVIATNYNIDPLIIDEQWNMMNVNRADEMITLTPQMLERLKFSRTSTLINKLEQIFPTTHGSKKEYRGDGVNVSIVMIASDAVGKNGHGGTRYFKQIRMTKGAYKQLLMETQTDAAKQVRKYYICLEELFVQYLLYQRAYELTKAETNLTAVVTENKFLSGKLNIVIAQNREVIAQNEGLARQNEGLSK